MFKQLSNVMRSMQKERTPEQLTDQVLVDRILNGEAELFELIMRRYNQLLFRLARSITGCDYEAEDAVQNGYVRAYEKLSQLKDGNRFKQWLCQIIRNEALAFFRSAGRSVTTLQTDLGNSEEGSMNEHFKCPEESPENLAEATRVRYCLEKSIDNLPDLYRETFVLHFVQQMTLNDTANILGVPLATVKNRIHRARNLVKGDVLREIETSVSDIFSFDGERCDRIVQQVMLRLEKRAFVKFLGERSVTARK